MNAQQVEPQLFTAPVRPYRSGNDLIVKVESHRSQSPRFREIV